jgi:GNAT superfamily N-acetyltransferase
MAELIYRRMEKHDIPATLEVRLSTIENAVTLEEMKRDYGVTPAGIATAMDGDLAGWLCEEKGEVLGFAMGDRTSGEVLVVAVRPHAEQRGIGSAVLRRVTEWLFDLGHQRVWLLSNPDPAVRAHGFYRQLGWQPTGERRGGDEVLELMRDVG